MAKRKKNPRVEPDPLDTIGVSLALRWTEPVEPDIPVPSDFDEAVGWAFNKWTKVVSRTWSSRAFHGTLDSDGQKIGGGSQGGVALYSTKAKALAALRHALEWESAWTLRKIDALIATETK